MVLIKDRSYPSHLAEKIKRILKNGSIPEARSKSREIAREYFDYESLSEKLCKILKEVFKTNVR